MMKNLRLFVLTALAGLAFVGCSNDDDTRPGNYSGDNMIRITAEMGSAATRATYAAGAKVPVFGLCIKNAASTSYSYNNVEVTYNEEEGWKAPEQLLWQDAARPVDIIAYAPYKNDDADLSAEQAYPVTVQADQTDPNDYSSDFIIFKKKDFVPQTDLSDDGSVSIKFKHALSLLDIKVEFRTEFYESLSSGNIIEGMTVEGTVLEGTCDFTEAEPTVKVASAGTVAAISLEEGTFTAPTTEESKAVAVYSCILIPQTVPAGKFKVSLFINGKLYEWASTSDLTLEAGMRHRLDLKAGKNRLEMTSTIGNLPGWDEEDLK